MPAQSGNAPLVELAEDRFEFSYSVCYVAASVRSKRKGEPMEESATVVEEVTEEELPEFALLIDVPD